MQVLLISDVYLICNCRNLAADLLPSSTTSSPPPPPTASPDADADADGDQPTSASVAGDEASSDSASVASSSAPSTSSTSNCSSSSYMVFNRRVRREELAREAVFASNLAETEVGALSCLLCLL